MTIDKQDSCPAFLNELFFDAFPKRDTDRQHSSFSSHSYQSAQRQRDTKPNSKLSTNFSDRHRSWHGNISLSSKYG